MTTSKCSVLLKFDKDDGLAWYPHKIPGLKLLSLNSGSQAIVGRDPYLCRTLRGAVIRSHWISQYEHHVVLTTKKRIDIDSNTISSRKAQYNLDYPPGATNVERREYEDRIALELRGQVRSQIRGALELRDIYIMHDRDRDIDRWITVNSETLESGIVRFTATSRRIDVNALRSELQQ